MKKLFFIFLLLILSMGMIGAGGAGQTAPKSPGQPDPKLLVKRVMEASGMNDQIRQLPQAFAVGFSQGKGQLPPELYSALEQETLRVWDTERILKGISMQLEKNLDAKTMQEVLVWLNSDLGKKTTAVEKAVSTPEGIQGLLAFMNSSEKTSPQKKRQDLAQRLTQATHQQEMQVELKLMTLSAVSDAINSALPKEKRTDSVTLKKKIEDMRPNMEEEAEKSELQAALYIYRSLKDEEFQRYVEFTESEAGKRYSQVSMEALKGELKVIVGRLGAVIGDVVRKKIAPEKELTGEIVLNLKDGGVIRWKSYKELEDRYCTYVSGGELCINKKEIAKVEKY